MYRWNGRYLYRCGVCGTESVEPIPPASELGAFYEAISGKKMTDWEARLERVRPALAAYIDRFSAVTGQAAPRRFLDVGGGVGYYCRAAQDAGIDATLVDWADDALRFARSRLEVRQVVRADVQRCAGAFAPRAFDFILARHVIEHMRDPRAFVEQLAAALSPGGVLQIETPDVASREQFRHPGVVRETYRVIRAANPEMGTAAAARRALAKSVSGVNPPKHLWGFTTAGLAGLLRDAGLDVVGVDRAVAGDATFDPLFDELQRYRPRTALSRAHDLWRWAATPLFHGRGMNLAITARPAGGVKR